MDSKVSLTGWPCELPSFAELSNLDVRFRNYEKLDVTLQDLKSKKKYVILFSEVLGYRFENAFSCTKLGNAFKVLNSPWIATMQTKPFRSRSIDTAQHYLISSDAGELEVVSLAAPTIAVETMPLDSADVNCLEKIISDLARRECEKLSQKVIGFLTKMTDGMQLGDDTPLKNMWEEICVQVQGQESVTWDGYLDIIESFILSEMAGLDAATIQAIWLQTEKGIDWSFDSERQEVPIVSEDIAQYILHFVVSSAENSTNERIEKYFEREVDQ